MFCSTDNLTSFDWRDRKAVNAPRQQGQCGCCYAFASAAALETANVAAGRALEQLSPEYLVECADQNGCQGGAVPAVFDFLQRAGGAPTEAAYPYTSGQGQVTGQCHTANSLPGKLVSYSVIESDPDGMRAALQQGALVAGKFRLSENIKYYTYYNSLAIKEI